MMRVNLFILIFAISITCISCGTLNDDELNNIEDDSSQELQEENNENIAIQSSSYIENSNDASDEFFKDIYFDNAHIDEDYKNIILEFVNGDDYSVNRLQELIDVEPDFIEYTDNYREYYLNSEDGVRIKMMVSSSEGTVADIQFLPEFPSLNKGGYTISDMLSNDLYTDNGDYTYSLNEEVFKNYSFENANPNQFALEKIVFDGRDIYIDNSIYLAASIITLEPTPDENGYVDDMFFEGGMCLQDGQGADAKMEFIFDINTKEVIDKYLPLQIVPEWDYGYSNTDLYD